MKIKNIALWALTIFFFLGTIVYLSTPGGALTGILFLLSAIFSCPIIHKVLKDIGKMPKKGVLIAAVLILFFTAAMVSPKTSDFDSTPNIEETQTNNNSNNNSTINTQTNEQNKIDTANKADSESVNDKDSQSIETVSDKKESNKSSVLKVYFLDVGQADSIIIESEGHYMVIDAGENGDGDFVVDYLKNLGAKSLDYVIGTHPHEDHIGGLDDVINSFDVDTVILPEVTTTTDTFSDVIDAISDNELSITLPEIGDKYSIGDAEFTVIAPNKDYGDELNNWSVSIKLTNGKNSFIMCGDAELGAENDICNNGIDLKADVIKIGHHGSDTSTSEAILKAVKPSYAVISVGLDNQYGHPAAETIQKLKEAGIKYFRTDEQGTIICTSDGTKLKWNIRPSTSLKAGEVVSNTESNKNDQKVTEAPEKVQTTQDDKGIEVHITETGSKYHSAGCQYLRKSDIVVSLDDALVWGYEPCSRCNPPR